MGTMITLTLDTDEIRDNYANAMEAKVFVEEAGDRFETTKKGLTYEQDGVEAARIVKAAAAAGGTLRWYDERSLAILSAAALRAEGYTAEHLFDLADEFDWCKYVVVTSRGFFED